MYDRRDHVKKNLDKFMEASTEGGGNEPPIR